MYQLTAAIRKFVFLRKIPNNKIIANMHADIKKIRNAAVAINIQNAKSDNVISLNTQDILDLTAKYVRKES